jgi:hypothetical protein
MLARQQMLARRQTPVLVYHSVTAVPFMSRCSAFTRRSPLICEARTNLRAPASAREARRGEITLYQFANTPKQNPDSKF